MFTQPDSTKSKKIDFLDRLKDDSALTNQMKELAVQVCTPSTVRYSKTPKGGSISSNSEMQKSLAFISKENINLNPYKYRPVILKNQLQYNKSDESLDTVVTGFSRISSLTFQDNKVKRKKGGVKIIEVAVAEQTEDNEELDYRNAELIDFDTKKSLTEMKFKDVQCE